MSSCQGWCQCIDHSPPPPDGRTKTKLTVDGRCRLLLIREETGGPSRQVSLWADVLMCVFSYADIDSLREVNCDWCVMCDGVICDVWCDM